MRKSKAFAQNTEASVSSLVKCLLFWELYKQLMELACLSTASQNDGTDTKNYRMLLTPYAYKKLERQAELVHKVKVTKILPDDSVIGNSSIKSPLKALHVSCEM